jgi:hypothetical protein
MLLNPPIKNRSIPFPTRIPYQYVFLCHFAEVYSANALKFPSKKTIASLSNTHSLVTSQKSMIPMLTNFPSKEETSHFPIRIPLSLRRSLFRQCAQIRQLKFNRFTSQYAFPCHFAEVYSANALKFLIIKPIASISNMHSFVTSQKSIPPMGLNPPIKHQSHSFPIRIPLSLRRSL